MRKLVFIAGLAAAVLTGSAAADIIITEVIPGVLTHADTGDTVELFNAGPGAVDLTDYVITDMDPASVESDLASEGTFAPGALGMPLLQPEEFAVVIFSASDEDPNARFIQTNYGLRIWAPLATSGSSFLDTGNEQLLLLDGAGNAVDSLAWTDAGDTFSTDKLEDLSALTSPTADYGITLGSAAWAGDDNIANSVAYQNSAIEFSALSGVSTYGGGVLRRRSTNSVFQIGNPDSASDWEAVPRELATLGNASDRLTTSGGIQLVRATEFIDEWIGELESSNFPERRVARGEDQNPSDFIVPPPGDFTIWNDLWDQIVAGEWETANGTAATIGYELIQFLDRNTNETLYVLRELAYPDQPGFRGQGIYVYDPNPSSRDNFILQAPHPINDLTTMDELGFTLPQVRPRVSMIAGTHRNNHTSETLCDGTLSNGDSYRISDVAHFDINFFHETHKYFRTLLPDAVTVQIHGFCCPGNSSHPDLTDDVVVSNGVDAAPQPTEFARLFAEEINALNFVADNGTPDADQTTAGLYGESADELGGTTNLQGRITNGVNLGDECDTPAGSANGLFVHLEQDPDVREEPQHIIDAMLNTLAIYSGPPLLVDLESFTATAAYPGAPVVITWNTSAEFDNAGFNIYEAELNSVLKPGEKLNNQIIPAAGNEFSGAEYIFEDERPLIAGESRYYFLEDFEFGGKRTFHGPIRAKVSPQEPLAVKDWDLF